MNSWKELGAHTSTDNSLVAKEADVIFLAVKPHILTEALKQIESSPIASQIKNKLFISILAGITIKDLEEVRNKWWNINYKNPPKTPSKIKVHRFNIYLFVEVVEQI